MITDVDRVLIINRTTGQILNEFGPIFGSCEEDYLSSSNTILVSSGSSGVIKEYDINTGEIVWEWGTDVLIQIAYSNCAFLIGYEVLWILIGIFMKSKLKWVLIIPLIALIGLEIYIMAGYYDLTTKIFVASING